MVGVVISLFAVVGWLAPVASAANTNNFVISNYEIDYVLGRDEQKRSTLKTTETITAEFPAYDQNHGIERAIPQRYDNHPTNLKIVSVTDPTNKPFPYSTRESNDNLILRIGDANRYVHGRVTYKITYTQQDVTRYYANINRDEFYWDTNGTEWAVPIQNLSVNLHLADDIELPSVKNVQCYQGSSGSATPCEAVPKYDGYSFVVSQLGSYENVTIATGFAPGTFAAYEMSLMERLAYIYIIVLVVGGIIAALVTIWLSVRWYQWTHRTKDIGTIVPEYIPPKDTSVTTAASIGQVIGSVFTAQLLDFAVRHYIKIYQTRDKGFLRSAEYDIEIIRDITDLKAEEQEILSDIFSGSTTVGSRLELKTLKNNTSMYNRVKDNDKKLSELVKGGYKLRHKDTGKSAWFKKRGWIVLGLAAVTLNPFLLIAAGIIFILAYTLWPLTDSGLALSRYLKGLKLYIEVAETERIKMLQSPEGAAKVGGVDANDTSQLVKLYERVLPYAVLFGQEKEWNKHIGEIYEQTGTNPSWYSGSSPVFNAAVFSSAMSSFSTAASYSSASSSSSGGSSGGGSSGGGGGGGGGGGW